MKRQIVSLVLFLIPFTAYGQEFFLNADLVSKYMWRGMKNGNAAVQPYMGFQIENFTFTAWGSTEFRRRNNEIDLIVEYEHKNWTFSLMNVFFQDEGERFRYFHYNPKTTGHTLEAGAAYTLSPWFPLQAAWYTTFAGNDYTENGHRAWSTYWEFLLPFTIGKIDLEAEAGISPWKGMYTDTFAVNNLALTAGWDWELTDKFTLTPFAKIGYNPFEKNFYWVIGITL
ncbi:MAG: hypothetical protein LIP08_00840 [Bacteroides sp.]|nr:hypothetical protein [Bacteroides sp.]